MSKEIATVKTKIDFGDVFTKADMKEIAEEWMAIRVGEVRRGKIIRKKYKPSTIRRRRRFGLQTAFVDLTGNRKYSRKQWRLLEQFQARALSNSKAVIEWKRNDAATLYGYHVRRYGKIF